MELVSAPDRQKLGLYLHRSEVHAQRELDNDRKGGLGKASARARGRFEGFALCQSATLYYPWKPLGVLIEQTEMQDMSMSMVHKVERERARVNANLHAQEQKPKAKKGESAFAAEKDENELGDDQEGDSRRADTAQRENGSSSLQLVGRLDGQRHKSRREADGLQMLRSFVRDSDYRLSQVKAEAPGTAYGLDYNVSELEALMPPRHLYPPVHADKKVHSALDAEGTQPEDGGVEKKASLSGAPHSAREVRGSSQIARQPVPPNGPPPRGKRPALPNMALALKDGGGATASSAGPQSDRSHRREVYVSGIATEMKPRALPIRLPSLGDFIASSGPSSSGAGSGGRGERSQVREAINLLLGLPRHAALKLTQEELASKRKVNFKRKIEKQLDNCWTDRHMWKRCMNAQTKMEIDEMRKRYPGSEQNPALFEKYRQELADGEREADGGAGGASGGAAGPYGIGPAAGGGLGPAVGGAGGGASGGARGGAGGGEGGAGGGEDTAQGAGTGAGGRRKRPTEAEKAHAEAEEAAAYDKVVQLLREPDPTISPVARLRSTLGSYQAARERHKGDLEKMLLSMDADRLNSLKRRASHLKPTAGGAYSDAKASHALCRLEAEKDMLEQHLQERMKQQYLWYRNLWTYVQSDKREMPAVAHFIFDFVKQVLEYGEIFTAAMYFAMLEQIENFEYTSVISGLVINMIKEIQDVTPELVVKFFEVSRDSVPLHILELVEQSGKIDPPLAAGTAALPGANGSAPEPRGTTFVTEA